MKNFFQSLAKSPIISLSLGFLIIIFIGAILLKLPCATFYGISFIDAIFTSTSAVCVTGLVVKDIALNFTIFGQIVILFLIQIGALGIMTGAVFIVLFLKRELGIKAGAGLKTIFEEEYIPQIKDTIKFIIISAIIIEAIGAIFLFFCGQSVFNSIFHSVSAFCNAGFSLFDNSLEGFRSSVLVNILFCFLIISGGIGFIALKDIHKKIIGFFKKEKTRFSLYSKIVLLSTIFLILFGASLFYVFEKENLNFLSEKDLVTASFFQSITARTAGFNTVDIEKLSDPTFLLLMFLMFIGGAPASTAGGIKVVGLVLIFSSLISFFRGRKEVVIFKRSIPQNILKTVFMIFFVYLLFCLVISLLLLYTEKGEFNKILFEVFSALSTVGLTCGITPNLTDFGKILIMISMFVGRLMPLSLAIIGSRELVKTEINHLEEKIILG